MPLSFPGIREKQAHIFLASLVAQKAGLICVQSFDCMWLSFEVRRVTQKTVSETTLKRFFGAANRNFQFSSATKNALSLYVGYESWSLFVESLTDFQPLSKMHSFWNELRKKALRISKFTNSTIKKHATIPYDYTIPRHFAEVHLNAFFESDSLITSLIAPSGYGKSILISQLVDKYWLNDNASFQNDIIWVITGQSVGGLANVGFNLDEWFSNQIGLNEAENMHVFFKNNPSEVCGRLVMVLDGFDDSFQKDAQIQAFFIRLIDLITVNRHCTYIKVILSLRPATWEFIAGQIDSSSFLKSHWYLGPAYNPATHINVPEFSESEVRSILKNVFPVPFVEMNSDSELLSQLSRPCYMELLYHKYLIFNKKDTEAGHVEAFELISDFIKEKIYQNKFSSGKIALLKRFLEHSDLDQYKGNVDVELFVSDGPTYKRAYQDLLGCGVLIEENFSTRLFYKKVVRINHDNLIEYFIATEFILTSRKKGQKNLFFDAHALYKTSTQLIPILKWLIYLKIDQDNLGELTQITSLDLPSHEKEILIVFMSQLLENKFLAGDVLFKKEDLLRKNPSFFSHLLRPGVNHVAYITALATFSRLSIKTNEKVPDLILRKKSNLNL